MEEDKIRNISLLLIGGSAGSLEVLIAVLPQLKPLQNWAMVIVLHRKSTDDSLLENLIAMKTVIPVKEIEDKTPLEAGFIYVVPSDYHLLFEKNGLLSLDVSDKVNYSRPSIDVVFESAADVFGSRATAVLLSGANADGTQGLLAIQQMGGTVVIQDPDSAEMPYMPKFAINKMTANHLVDADGLVAFINNLGF
ncbi:chemotaxis protein CheB [Flavobacterium psychrotrophum]|uniref:chemotaxis protein CheB n=1 Tax=Flavobacterium psychrotrophum TaxID=2294119 RepID=UPI000E30BFA6|nr:chemotaxis protein CheB [Flavobacterium psychrotrophum]